MIMDRSLLDPGASFQLQPAGFFCCGSTKMYGIEYLAAQPITGRSWPSVHFYVHSETPHIDGKVSKTTLSLDHFESQSTECFMRISKGSVF